MSSKFQRLVLVSRVSRGDLYKKGPVESLALYCRNNACDASRASSWRRAPGATVYVNFPLHVAPRTLFREKASREGAPSWKYRCYKRERRYVIQYGAGKKREREGNRRDDSCAIHIDVPLLPQLHLCFFVITLCNFIRWCCMWALLIFLRSILWTKNIIK